MGFPEKENGNLPLLKLSAGKFQVKVKVVGVPGGYAKNLGKFPVIPEGGGHNNIDLKFKWVNFKKEN